MIHLVALAIGAVIVGAFMLLLRWAVSNGKIFAIVMGVTLTLAAYIWGSLALSVAGYLQ